MRVTFCKSMFLKANVLIVLFRKIYEELSIDVFVEDAPFTNKRVNAHTN